jgi:hypothetical protein
MTEPRPPAEEPSRAATAVDAALLTGLAAVLMALTWRGWCDPFVDFGRELYVPWQLLEGRVLYRDLAYHNGPLSPYAHALWFRLTGVSLSALLVLNAAVLAAATTLLVALGRRVAGRGPALAAGAVFLSVFAFGQLSGTGNYNWLCPYSHELTHGVTLGLLSLWLLGRHADGRGDAPVVGAGLAVGACLLGKPEVSLAAAGANVVVLVALGVAARSARGAPLRAGLLWCAGALAPLLVAALLLAAAMPLAEAARGALGAWTSALDARNLGVSFFHRISGLDDPGASLGALWVVSRGLLVLFGGGAAVSLWTGRLDRPRVAQAITVASGGVVLAALLLTAQPWAALLLPLPWVLLAAFVLAARALRAPAAPGPTLTRGVVGLGLLAFAGLLLAKIVLRVTPGHYGFALAAPATATVTLLLLRWAPDLLTRRGGHAAVFQVVAGVTLSLFCLVQVRATLGWHRLKVVRVGEGADAFRADPRAEVLVRALEWLRREAPPGASLSSMPDCELLNYLARRASPVRFGQLNPHQVALHGERDILAALERAPPDLVALVHKDDRDYGTRFFGRDYGVDLAGWVERRYEPAARFGDPPFQDRSVTGIVLLRRRP